MPASSANGMNSSGGIRPRSGSSQRTEASTRRPAPCPGPRSAGSARRVVARERAAEAGGHRRRRASSSAPPRRARPPVPGRLTWYIAASAWRSSSSAVSGVWGWTRCRRSRRARAPVPAIGERLPQRLARPAWRPPRRHAAARRSRSVSQDQRTRRRPGARAGPDRGVPPEAARRSGTGSRRPRRGRASR